MSSSPLKLKACDRCASIKQVCDRSLLNPESCSRCTRLELPCAITRVHKPMGRPRKNRIPAVAPPQPSEEDGTSNVAVSRPKRVQRTRSGCSTCKQRRKKCDEVLPICGDCRRLGLPCSRAAVARCASPSLSHVMLSIMYSGITAQEHHLLQHYTAVVSRSLSVVPDEINSFILLFVPMALQQPAMRNALLGLSATHLKRIHPGYEYVAVEYQNRAVKQANALLRRGDDEAAREGLAAILFLCMQEICEGGSRRWPMHLEAAVTLINNKGGPTSFPSNLQFLIESVAYFDSIATLSSSKSAFLDQQFYIPRTPPHPHPLFGTAHPLFAIIADISHLAQLSPHPQTAALAHDLELQLQSWTPCPTHPPPLTAAAVMLQWAALLRLHMVVDDSRDLTHPKVRAAVANILGALQTIPPGHLVESMLVFPVFAAGVAALTKEERDVVRERFVVMERSIGFGNVFDAHSAVEGRWAAEGGWGDGGMGCWESVVAETGGTLIMG